MSRQYNAVGALCCQSSWHFCHQFVGGRAVSGKRLIAKICHFQAEITYCLQLSPLFSAHNRLLAILLLHYCNSQPVIRLNYSIHHTLYIHLHLSKVVLIPSHQVFGMHSQLLSKGFALLRPPTISQALDSNLPFSCGSNERSFLKDFVSCTPGTSGGRLAA